ncbi:hypothetical protein Tco_0093971, partial [Tanacetum coccineum]
MGHGRGSPYYPVGNRVVAMRSTSVTPTPFCSVGALVIVIISRVIVCRGVARGCGLDCVPCGTAEPVLLATVCGLCSLRNCGVHAPCGHVQVMLLAERLAF